MNVKVKLVFRKMLVFTEVSDEKKKKKFKLLVNGLFRLVKKRIDKRTGIYDFTFLENDKIHAQWFSFDEDNDYTEYDYVVTLDKSVLDNEKVMRRLHELEMEFAKNKAASQKEYLELSAKYSREQELKEKALTHLKRYIWERDFPVFSDDEDFEDMVDWLKANKDDVVFRKKLKLMTRYELAADTVIDLFSFYAFLQTLGKFFLDNFLYNLIAFIYNLEFALQLDFSALFPWIGIPVALKGLRSWFAVDSNERTCHNFLEEIDDYEEDQKLELRESLGREYESPDNLMRRFVIRERVFLDIHPEYDSEEMRKELNHLLRPQSEDNVEERFANLERLTSVERAIHSEEARIGAKAEVEAVFSQDVLKERLLYLGFGVVQIDEDPFIFILSDTIEKLKSFPFYGMELEIVRLIEVGIDYAKAYMLYSNTVEFKTSFEHYELSKRRDSACAAALRKQEQIRKIDSLVSSLMQFVEDREYMSPEIRERAQSALQTEACKSLAFNPVEKVDEQA